MKGTWLGEFEELVLLTVGILHGDAYGLAIAEEIQEQTGRKATVSTIHTVLYRLEKKGFVRSEMGGATQMRGGRRKRIFTITASGHRALQVSVEQRSRMFKLIPKINFNLNPGAI